MQASEIIAELNSKILEKITFHGNSKPEITLTNELQELLTIRANILANLNSGSSGIGGNASAAKQDEQTDLLETLTTLLPQSNGKLSVESVSTNEPVQRVNAILTDSNPIFIKDLLLSQLGTNNSYLNTGYAVATINIEAISNSFQVWECNSSNAELYQPRIYSSPGDYHINGDIPPLKGLLILPGDLKNIKIKPSVSDPPTTVQPIIFTLTLSRYSEWVPQKEQYNIRSYFDGAISELGSSSSSPANSDTANVGINGLFKRLLQRLTVLLPQSNGKLDVQATLTNGGDASSALQNQQTQILTNLQNLVNNDGATYDRTLARLLSDIYFHTIGINGVNSSAATSDTGSFTFFQLFKRLLTRITELFQVKAGNVLPQSTDTAIVATLRDAISLPRKVSITGFTSNGTTNNNLLDASGNGVATDVRDYQSGVLTTVSTTSTGNYTIQGSFNSAFTIGVKNLSIQEIDVLNQNPILGSIGANNGVTRSFLLNLQGINYLRVILSVAGAGITAYAVLNQAPSSSLQLNVQQATSSNLNANIGSIGSLNTVTSVSSLTSIGFASIINDASNAAITTTVTSSTITPMGGLSYLAYIHILSVSGTNPVLLVEIQESIDNEFNWSTVYTFAPINSVGSYASPKLPYRGNKIRYIQNVSGVSPTFTRIINRYTYNDIPSVPVAPRKLGGIAQTADLAVYGRVLKVAVNNQTASVIYLQVFINKATALSTGDIPVDVYPVAANFALVLATETFGNYGTFLGVNARLGLSSTFASYTAIASLTNTSLFVDYH